MMGEIKETAAKKERTAVMLSVFALLQTLLVGFNHFLERVTRAKSEIL